MCLLLSLQNKYSLPCLFIQLFDELFSAATCIGIIHPDLTAPVVLTINRFDHFLAGIRLYFYPTGHFLHINTTQHFFFRSLISRINWRKLAL